ncbi:LamG-like jellyroll fold domain-containing protein [Actinoplanes xinjiangensis]|uniref:LamG-like jellyroll fold domain-containing protein n=1 Tax=Actinoplanes xinjiangensis TaxID=512350 RepID=UPI00343EC63A
MALPVSTSGLTINADTYGNLTGKDKGGRTLLSAAAPIMWDSSTTSTTPTGTRSLQRDSRAGQPAESTAQGPGPDARIARVGTKVRSGHLELVPDKTLLTGRDTKFPVYIDPTFEWQRTGSATTGWSTVSKNFPATNYWKTTPDPRGRMQVGNSGSILSRTLLNFAIPTTTLAGGNINSAVLKVTQTWAYSCNPSRVNLYAPPTATLTAANANWNDWDNVNLGAVVDYKSVAHGYDTSCKAEAVPFDVKDVIVADVAKSKKTQTFMLAAHDQSATNGWKEFLETSPRLEITYNHKPNNPSNLHTSPNTACNAASVVGEGSVTLYATFSDRNGGSVGASYKVWKAGSATNLIAPTNPQGLYSTSGQELPYQISRDTLRNAVPVGQIAKFYWAAQATDYGMSSDWVTCSFTYDRSRPGTPEMAPIAPGTTTIGTPVTVTINPPAGTVPASYTYQVNAGMYRTVTPTAGIAQITVIPTRFTNTLTVTGVSPGGNIGPASSLTFNSAAPADAAAADLNGDDVADFITAGTGTDEFPAGLWYSRGQHGGQLVTTLGNIGSQGAGNPEGTSTDFTGTQILTGRFNGAAWQDTLAYYPPDHTIAPGTAAILFGNGEGTTLRARTSGNSSRINGGSLAGFDWNTFLDIRDPLRLANAGAQATTRYDDLIGIAERSDDTSTLVYYPNNGTTGGYNETQALTAPTPTGGSDWNTWAITGAQTATGSALFLWQASTGKLFLWNNLHYDAETVAITYQQHLLSSAWNTGKTLALRAADFNTDGTADLWAVGPDQKVAAFLVTGLNTSTGAGTISAPSQQQLAASAHSWMLDDCNAADPGQTCDTVTTGQIRDTSGSLHNTNASTAKWDTGDLYSPALRFDDATTASSITTPKAVNTTKDFTISFWAKPTNYAGTVISQDGANVPGLRVYTSASGAWVFDMPSSDTTGTATTWDTAATAANAVNLDLWQQITVTYHRSTAQMSLYINNELAATATHTSAWEALGSLRISGVQTNTAGALASPFRGKLAKIQTWNTVTTTPPAFTSGFETTSPKLTWKNAVSNGTGHGGTGNISGVCCSLTGPELVTSGLMEAGAHSGTNALLYSGKDGSATASYAYMKAFDLRHLTLRQNSVLSYWIYPQSPNDSTMVSGANSTCVAVDLVFTDGTNLRDSNAVDRRGNRVHPALQCGKLAMDAWNEVIVPVGAIGAGKQIDTLEIGYDQPANTGGYRGYIDDIAISDVVSSPLFITGAESGDPALTWTSSVSTGAPRGGITNVGGVCCSLTGPEMLGPVSPPAGAHSGVNTLMYSGGDTSLNSSHAYTKAYQLNNLAVTPTTKLKYWIYPESNAASGMATGSNSTCVAVDLIFFDQKTNSYSNLRDETGATDQKGNRVHPSLQCGKLTMDTWNEVIVPIGAIANGKQLVQADVGYDQPTKTGGYRGFIDDIRISES